MKVDGAGLEPAVFLCDGFTVRWSTLRFGRRKTDVPRTSCAPVSRVTYLQSELRSLYYHYPMTTVAPAGLEPDISGLRGRRPDL